MILHIKKKLLMKKFFKTWDPKTIAESEKYVMTWKSVSFPVIEYALFSHMWVCDNCDILSLNPQLHGLKILHSSDNK